MAKKVFGKRILAAILTFIMVINLANIGVFAAETDGFATVQNFSDAYYKQDGSVGTAADWEIHLSKTAAPAAEDNVFDITLEIQTKDTFTQVAGSTHGAAVLVLDVSSSMAKETGSCQSCGKSESHNDHRGRNPVCNYQGVTHLQLLKAAVKSFLDSYVEDAAAGDKRLIAVVKFATNADTVLSWIDINDAQNLQTVKSAIDAMNSTSGTNIEAGLVLGRNLLNMDAVKSIPLANQSLILFSDGSPTSAVGNVNDTSVTQVTSGGNGFGFGYVSNGTSDDLDEILAAVSAKKKAVAYNTEADLLKSVFGEENVITSSADSLALDLAAEAGGIVTTKTNASTVTDPMGTGVSMISVSSDYSAATQKWDLSKITPTVSDGITTYTITYQVKLDPNEAALDPAYPGYTVLTPANGVTTLDYTYGEGNTPVHAQFNVPAIRGVRTFTVRYAYTSNVPQNAPAVPAEATFKAGESVRVADAPAMDHFTFSGWSHADFVMPAEDVVITGSWSENAKYDYALTYIANFGQNETKADAENISGVYADSHNITVDANTFHRENYTFIGWNTMADGTGIAYAAENVIVLTAESNVAALYAQWAENPKYDYALTYHANFGENQIKADGQNVAGTYATSHNIAVDANTFVRDNYTFIGWNTMPDGTGTAYAVNEIVALTAENNAAVLYAQWEENAKFDYAVIYDANFGEGETVADEENTAHTYATSHSITVNANTFVRANHTFLGWSDAPDGQIVYLPGDSIRFEQGGSKILYALWEEHPKYDYTVIYNGNGGALENGELAYGDSENVIATYETSMNIHVDENTFVRENYTFIGWNTMPDGAGTALEAGDIISLTAQLNTVTLYAQWEENAKYDYTLSYDANFGDPTETRIDTESVTAVYDLTYGITVDANTFVRRGYTFVGWNTQADGTGAALAAEDVITLSAQLNTATVYAQWELNTYSYEVIYKVRVNGNAYEIFAGDLPEGAPVGETVSFGAVIDKDYLLSLGLPMALTDENYTYELNAFEGVIISEAGNVVTVYYTFIEKPVYPPVPPVEEEEIEIDPPAPPVEEEPPVIEIPDEDVPMADLPKTGDGIALYVAFAVLSGMGLAVLKSKKSLFIQEDEEA